LTIKGFWDKSYRCEKRLAFVKIWPEFLERIIVPRITHKYQYNTRNDTRWPRREEGQGARGKAPHGQYIKSNCIISECGAMEHLDFLSLRLSEVLFHRYSVGWKMKCQTAIIAD
jgi:hypothetical protein